MGNVNRLSASHNNLVEGGEVVHADHSEDGGSVALCFCEAIEVEAEGPLAALDLYRRLHVFSIAERNQKSIYFLMKFSSAANSSSLNPFWSVNFSSVKELAGG